jgi:deoxyribodipyrimidine photolyase-related protein
MRRFSKMLTAQGFNVEYTKLDHPDNTGLFSSEVKRIVSKHVDRIIVTHPSEYRLRNNKI